jgi:hypothetical protein
MKHAIEPSRIVLTAEPGDPVEVRLSLIQSLQVKGMRFTAAEVTTFLSGPEGPRESVPAGK